MSENTWYDEIPQLTIVTKNHADNFNQINHQVHSNTKSNKGRIERLQTDLTRLEGSMDSIAFNVDYLNEEVEQLDEDITRLNESLKGKANSEDIPTTLPANGGNADTLGELSSGNFVQMPPVRVSLEVLQNANYPYSYRSAISDGTQIGLPANSWYHIDYFRHLDNNGFGFQMAYPLNNGGAICARWSSGTTWQTWTQIHDTTYNKALPMNGGRMMGDIGYTGSGYSGRAISFHAGDANGVGISVSAGGLALVGGGESANAYVTSFPDGGNGTTENAAITADSAIIFRSGVQSGFSDAKKIVMDNTGKLNLSSTGMMFPTTGGSWISGKTTTNVIEMTGDTSGSYHPMIKYTMNSGNVANLGAIQNKFGFWGYLSTQTANSTNAGAYLNIDTGIWQSNGGMTAGNSNGNLKRTTISTASPSGGVNGDVWIKYS